MERRWVGLRGSEGEKGAVKSIRRNEERVEDIRETNQADGKGDKGMNLSRKERSKKRGCGEGVPQLKRRMTHVSFSLSKDARLV